MVIEQRYAWARAYRGGQLVCARVHVTIGRDLDRLGLARHERRYVVARFLERLDPALRSELIELARRRGMAARRIAETLPAADRDRPGGPSPRTPAHGRSPAGAPAALRRATRDRVRTVRAAPSAVTGDEPTHRLSQDQVLALKFAAHRQLARWAKTRPLRPRQHAQRTALVRAVRILEDKAFAAGCDVRPTSDG